MNAKELCESAKKGYACPDDICRGCDVTLCGFDKEFYESEIMRFADYGDEEGHDAMDDDYRDPEDAKGDIFHDK